MKKGFINQTDKMVDVITRNLYIVYADEFYFVDELYCGHWYNFSPSG